MVSLNENLLTKEECVFIKHIGIPTDENGCRIEKKLAKSLCVTRTDEETIVIEYSRLCELYRGLALLKEDLLPGESRKQPRALDSLAVMLDCSRNAVPTVEALKIYILDLAALGFDQLQLYTEDTYEIKEYPYFGHLRGRYTAEEIRELDAFAKNYGVELVPAVQTLAHLNAIFKWGCFEEIHDADDILLCGEEKTYEFIDHMMASIRSMYSTDKIHIGMDEAHMMGLGKYFDRNGYHDRMEIFLKHIQRITEIAHKYGFKPMMWSDMYFKAFSKGDRFCESRGVMFNREVLEQIPEDMALIGWNYWVQPDGWYEEMIATHLAMEREFIFGGGFQKWTGFCPTTHHALTACRQGLSASYHYNIRKVILTGWGDDGAEGSMYMMLPGLALYAESCYLGDMSDEAIDHRLQILFGRSLRDFYLAEEIHAIPDHVKNDETPPRDINKLLLWNDPLLGLYDRHILPGTNVHLAKTAELLRTAAEHGDRFDYVFETLYRLCDFLAAKAEIGITLRNAFLKGDKTRLLGIKETIPLMVEKLDFFHVTFRKNWLRENKIFGFEVQDIRFGTLRARLVYTEQILDCYLKGEVSSIPELEEPTLYVDCREDDPEKPLHAITLHWKQIVSANSL